MMELVQRLCRFPGCTRPTAPGDGTGRPPVYCDDPTHNRASAWRARNTAGGLTAPAAASAPVTPNEGPVDAARGRAKAITAQVRDMAEVLEDRLIVLLAELRTLENSGAVEAQLDSVRTRAEAAMAEANARAADAQAALQRAEDDRAESEAAAQEATQAARQAEAALTQGQADWGQIRADLDQQLADAAAERAQLVEAQTAEREQLVADAGEQLAAAEAVAHQQAGTVADLARQVAVLTSERDNARQSVEQERATGDRRVADLQRVVDRQVARHDADVAELRHEVAEQRTRADRAEALLQQPAPAGSHPAGLR